MANTNNNTHIGKDNMDTQKVKKTNYYKSDYHFKKESVSTKNINYKELKEHKTKAYYLGVKTKFENKSLVPNDCKKLMESLKNKKNLIYRKNVYKSFILGTFASAKEYDFLAKLERIKI